MNKCSRHDHAKSAISWITLVSLSLWLAVAAAWWISSRVEYGYPLWYQVLAIDEHIARYAPHHPTRKGFAEVGAEGHRQAFADITAAVHGRGVTLAQIRYQTPAGHQVALLGAEEITHLEDVARLLRRAGWATLAVLPGWLVLAIWCSGRALPPWRHRLLAVSGLLLLVLLPLLIAGPTAVFYQFHVWLFPPENPWFFYWEESLMSTLMKAPDLFGAIAAQIGVLALALFFPVQSIGRRLGRLLVRR
jgi:hypothetical protein